MEINNIDAWNMDCSNDSGDNPSDNASELWNSIKVASDKKKEKVYIYYYYNVKIFFYLFCLF